MGKTPFRLRVQPLSFWSYLYFSAMLLMVACEPSGGSGSSAIVAAGAAPAPAPTPTETSTGPGPAPSASPDPTEGSAASEVFRRTNEYRVANGAAPFARSDRLAAAAQAYAEAMASQGFFSHTGLDGSTPGDRIAAQGYSARAWGENIAYGYATPEQVMSGWISSPGHRANLVNAAYTELGVGFALSGSGTAYWVQDFGKP